MLSSALWGVPGRSGRPLFNLADLISGRIGGGMADRDKRGRFLPGHSIRKRRRYRPDVVRLAERIRLADSSGDRDKRGRFVVGHAFWHRWRAARSAGPGTAADQGRDRAGRKLPDREALGSDRGIFQLAAYLSGLDRIGRRRLLRILRRRRRRRDRKRDRRARQREQAERAIFGGE